MDKKILREWLEMRGVPTKTLERLSNFAKEAEEYVFPKTFSIEEAVTRLVDLTKKIVSPEELTLLENKLRERLKKKMLTFQYTEEGYDSCQANREISKIISQLICIGGIYQETRDYLGLELTPKEIKDLLNLDFKLSESELRMLGQITICIGGNQEFLFPGVTKSYEEVPDLESFALETLLGEPKISVRHLTGVGGLRFDKEWNYCLSFINFTKEKIEEDRRFYPGLGIAYSLLLSNDILRFPTVARLKREQPSLFQELKKIIREFQSEDQKIYNISLVHSAYIPPIQEIVEARRWIAKGLERFQTRLGSAFHTPSYQYNFWKILGKLLAKGAFEEFQNTLKCLRLIDKLFTFNSPIHLPWSSGYLSHHWIGRVTNGRGEYAIRYGIGLAETNSSLEARVYTVSNATGTLKTAVKLITYSDLFFREKKTSWWIWNSAQEEVKQIIEAGFISFAISACKKI